MSAPKTLLRAKNGAAYPTRHERRMLLGGVGAAALALGLSCTAGVPMIEPHDAGERDAEVSSAPDASLPESSDAQDFPGKDASGDVAPDAGAEGGDS